ncbi:MAG TPA: acyltransferase family protein, partial [Acidimicrobiales bacterium]|nr:acyltransferase family protein [Acidimicrobiales bacterium]
MRAIDGIRGLGIAAVIGYHAWPSLVPGGLLGVEVFFVLSGFLLTGLLLDEHRRQGRVDWVRYARRRIRRLAPTL